MFDFNKIAAATLGGLVGASVAVGLFAIVVKCTENKEKK